MYGQSPPFRPGGGVGGVAQPQQIHLHPNNFLNPNFFHLQQHPTFLPHLYPFLQNPIPFPQIPQQFPFSNLPFQNNPDITKVQAPPANGSDNVNIPHQRVQNEMIENVDMAATRAQSELLEAGENVSAWKVSQEALLKVRVGSWESLGFQMQQVPSLNRLMGIERKVNAFIDCFVAVRRITSLHDLEVAICEIEGVERFEQLGLGPLLRHPLVVHYFSVSYDLTEIYTIKTEEIISCLCEFIANEKQKKFKVDTFLDLVSQKKSVGGKEKLCVRVQDFKEYIDHIKRQRKSENRVLDKCFEKMKTTSVKKSSKLPLFPSKKKELDEHLTAISQRMQSLSSKNIQFCGKHTRFASSSSDDDDNGCEADEYNQNRDENNIESNRSLSLPNVTSDRVSGCPYPSATEEMNRMGLKNKAESRACGVRSNVGNVFSQGKRRFENMSSSTSLPRKLRKRNKFDEDLSNKSSGNEGTGGHSLPTELSKVFIATWKDSCRMNNIDEIVTREPFCIGQADSSFMFSLVNWVLPYAQRYIYNAYPDKYIQLKQSDFKDLKHLKIFVVEKLFYRNVIKKREITSRERHQCNCLLKDNILYCTRKSNTHSVFLELTSLLLGQAPNLHLANFLYIVTTMVESGASEEQTEFFIVNSQKVPKLPAEETSWSLSPMENDNNSELLANCLPLNAEEQKSSLLKRRPDIHSSWPPVDWIKAPVFDSVSISASTLRKSISGDKGTSLEGRLKKSDIILARETNIDVDPTETTQGATVLSSPKIPESHPVDVSSMNLLLDTADPGLPDMTMFASRGGRDQGSSLSSAQLQQALLTGRLGEHVAFKYFVGKAGEPFVKWVNETSETGLPYDILLGADESSQEYVEVKATKSGRKNWFLLSLREWQFAIEKGESFSIAHVVLANDNVAKVTVYKNPARLCQLGNMRLAMVVRNE